MFTARHIERHGPWVGAVVAAVLWILLGSGFQSHFGKELLGALLSAAAISAGFMTTALSILLPLGSTAIGRRLHRRGHLPALFEYLRKAIYGCLWLAVVSVAGFFAFDDTLGISKWCSLPIVMTSVYTALALWRILEIMIKIFQAMAEPEDRQG